MPSSPYINYKLLRQAAKSNSTRSPKRQIPSFWNTNMSII